MLEHDFVSPEEQLEILRRNLASGHLNPAAGSVLSQPVGESGLQEKWIEDYLDQVYAPMVGSVPYRRRQEIRREMRAHILQLIAAHEELGSDPEEATTAALRQFGQPELVARKWLDELGIELSPTVGFERAPGSIMQALPYAVTRLAAGVSLWVGGGIMLDRYINGGTSASLFISLGAAIPLTIGYMTGRRHATGRSTLSMLLAQAITLPLWPFFMMFLMQVFRQRNPDFSIALMMGSVSFLALAPLGCIGAWAGARRSRAGRRRTRTATN